MIVNIIIIQLMLTAVLSEEEIGSPLKIAQCRAYCIHRFATDTNNQKTCFQDSDCYMCWEECQLLQANYPVWGGICGESEICYPGCQQACKFHRDISPIQQSVPVIQTRGEEVIFVKNHTAYWPTPSSKTRQQKGRGRPLVYVVMRRLPGKMWKQITQTLELFSRIPDDLSTGAMLRVLVVDREGLLTIYSPVASESTLRSANDIAKSFGQVSVSSLFKTPQINNVSFAIGPAVGATGDGQQWPPNNNNNDDNDEITDMVAPRYDASSSIKRSFWNLREISLIHQKVLVIAEVAWDPIPQLSTTSSASPLAFQQQQQRSVYYVTWEVDGGGLKGNLFTDSTCVTLTLWPDTVYHIQVELVDHTIATGRAQQSEDFLLDTHRAIAVEMDTSSPVVDDQGPEDEAILEDEDDDQIIGEQQRQSTESSFTGASSSSSSKNELKTYSRKIFIQSTATTSPSSVSRKMDITADYKDQYEVVFAIAAAFVVFLLLLVVLVYASCRHSDILAYPPFSTDIFSLKPDGKKVPDYTHYPKEFMPILTMVTENMSSRSTHSQKDLAVANSGQPSCSSTPTPSRSLSKKSSSSSSSFLDCRRDSLGLRSDQQSIISSNSHNNSNNNNNNTNHSHCKLNEKNSISAKQPTTTAVSAENNNSRAVADIASCNIVTTV